MARYKQTFLSFDRVLKLRSKGQKLNLGYHTSTFVSNIDLFDPLEFGISQKEAQHLDPSLRLTLEAARQVRASCPFPTSPLMD